ncbi:hypothetical protein TWF694_003468 [Orbilia ellipsospora]|uniref:Cell wall proline rich protein n=1 Tax=Orbilia ellipsospora TaxID=2528407 RepID=A0AAV9WZ55_9PEZI
MATLNSQAPMQSFVFPASKPSAAAPTKRPSSSSAIPSRTAISAGMPSPTYSDNGASPANSPSGFVFPMRQQTATVPRSAGNLLAPTNTNVQARTPPASPSPPNATLGERRFHARRQSELISSKPLSLGTLNQPFKFGSPASTTSPSKTTEGSPDKEATSPKFSTQNGLLSPPPEVTNLEAPGMGKLSAAPPPPGMQGKRGHAHRRSSAMSMSSTDVLNMMLTAAKANNTLNHNNKSGGSVPASPAASPENLLKEPFGGVADSVSVPAPDVKMALDVPSCESSASSVHNIATDDSTESARTSVEEAPRKPRVMFSDVPEIIPRPASAGTCSTFTTIRDGVSDSLHSYRNSISSMEELHTIDSRGRRASASDASGVPHPRRTKTDRRPNSADAATLLNGAQKTGWLFPPLSPKDPFAKKKGHSKHLSESSATEKPKPKRKSRKSSNPDGTPATPKKVKGGMKGWAGNILLKRHYKKRQLKHLPRRTPTPPLMHLDEIERLMLDGNYVLMPANMTDYQPRESSSLDESEFDQIDLGAFEIDVEMDSHFPVIDLDAALGPFLTPKSPNRPLSGFESARKRMHSAAGYTYHRRAESMPEMELFSLTEDIEGAGMNDVFEDTEEEDEEEDDEELDIVDGVANVRKGIKRKMSRLSEDTDPASESQRSEDGIKGGDTIISVEELSIPTPNTDIQFSPTLSTNTHLTKPMSNASGNVSYNSLHHASSFDQTPVVTPSTTSTSICPPTMPSTPQTSDFLPLPVSHLFPQEDDRLTIMSGASIYEDPALLGEPGPEIRMSVSVDDIPGTSQSSKRFYSLFSASNSRNTMAGIESTSSIGSPDKVKEKKDKRWSKMFSFWKAKPSTN